MLEKLKGAVTKGPDGPPVDPKVELKIRRGRDAMKKDAPQRKLSFCFWRGEHYAWINEKNTLVFDSTVTHAGGGGKPRHRVRQKRNFIHAIVEDKVSTATRRTPSYDISPATTDPEDAAAARLAGKVAVYGYDKWGVRRARVKCVTNALVAGEGFAMPYFDPNVGPFRPVVTEDGEPKVVGEGEIKIRVFDGNQVFWEEGCDFDDSPWHAIEEARPIDEVENYPGYYGGRLAPDANTSDNPTARRGDHLVLVTEYFERPTRQHVEGRRLIIANGKVICREESYPCRSPEGTVVDEPVLHRLSYTVDPGKDRDRGLVEHLIDAQRTLNDCVNKQVEWKNRCLNPRMVARKGSLLTRPDDTPGGVDYYVGNEKPTWETVPQIPAELFRMVEDAKQAMREISASAEVAAQPDVAARTVQAVLERSDAQWASFLNDLAEFDSRLMRHCLYLVQKHYTEDRTLKIRGRYGWETVADFQGAQMRGQADVRVLPDSLEPLTRQGRMDRVRFMVESFPGQVKPEQAMAALAGGTAENLIQGYELHVARAHSMIQTLKGGPDVFEQMLPQPDGTPGWMPRKQDNIDVHKQVVGEYMTTSDYDLLPPEVKEAFNLYYDGLVLLEQQAAFEAQQLQTMMAEQQGMQNAAKPQGPKAMPSKPAMDGPPAGQQP